MTTFNILYLYFVVVVYLFCTFTRLHHSKMAWPFRIIILNHFFVMFLFPPVACLHTDKFIDNTMIINFAMIIFLFTFVHWHIRSYNTAFRIGYKTIFFFSIHVRMCKYFRLRLCMTCAYFCFEMDQNQ